MAFFCCFGGKSKRQSYKVGSAFHKTPKGPTVVDVKRHNGNFGFSISGGVEDDRLILVSSADELKKLGPGDIILSVNGVSVAGCTVADVLSVVAACGNEVKLEVLPCKFGHASTLEFFLNRKKVHGGKGKKKLYEQIRKSILDNIYKHTISCTTRERRTEEVDGRQYFFVTEHEFGELLAADAFLECRTYGKHRYGTLRYRGLERFRSIRSEAGSMTRASIISDKRVRFDTSVAESSADSSGAAATVSSPSPAGISPILSAVEELMPAQPTSTAVIINQPKKEVLPSHVELPETIDESHMQIIDTPILRPENGEFGFIISGGHPHNIRVHAVHPMSVARGILKVDDIITHIGGQDLLGLAHAEVTQLICSLPFGRETIFTLLRAKKKPAGPWDAVPETQPSMEPKRYAVLERIAGRGFGFTVAYDEELSYSCVGDISPSGVSVRSGTLKVGDYISEVNGVNVRDIGYADVVQMIRNSPDVMRLQIERPVQNYQLTTKIEIRQTQIRLVEVSNQFREKVKVTEQQLHQTEEDLKSHISAWTKLRHRHDEMMQLTQRDPARLREIEELMKDYEARVVQEGVRAELLEEEFNSISLHLAHLGMLTSEIALSNVKVVAHEELQSLKAHVAMLQDIQEQRKALVEQLQAMHRNEFSPSQGAQPGAAAAAAGSGGTSGHDGGLELLVLTLQKEPQGNFGFTIVGGGNEQPFADKIIPNQAAERAGLKRGDAIISINGRDVKDGSHEEIVNMTVRSGDSVNLTVARPSMQNSAPKFNPPPLFVPRTEFVLTDLTGIANECLDVSIQIQLEKRLVADVRQALMASGVPHAHGAQQHQQQSSPLPDAAITSEDSAMRSDKQLLKEMEKRGLLL